MLRLAARLPDALVGLAPDRRSRTRPAPATIGHSRRGSRWLRRRVQQDRVEHGAEDVVLALVEGAVADPHRARAGVAGEVVARRLGQVAAPVDAVHDLQRAVVVGLEVGDELHELVGLPVEVEPVQRLQRERRVAHPGVAVVPVALAARRLGQRGRQRRDGRAGRHVGQALDRQRRALDRLAPAVVGDAGAGSSQRAPEARRRVEPRVGVVDVGRRRRGPRPTTARSRRRSPCVQHVAGAHAVALDARAPCRSAAGSSAPAPVASAAWRSSPTSVHSAGVAAVVEDRLADELDLDAALDALDGAHEHVVGVVVGRRARVRRDRVLAAPRAHRQRVAHDDPAARRLPRRDERVRARLVARARPGR